MKKSIIGFVVGLVLTPLIAILYFVSGLAPVATSDPPMPFEPLIAGAALHSRISREMPKDVPVKADEAAYRAGAMIYTHQCVVCHGALNQPESAIAKGMFPPPPQLLPPRKGVTDDPPGETFWKVKNGIRLTGMPGFHASLTDEQMWQVSLLLANADKLPEFVKQGLAASPPATEATPPQAAKP